MDNTPENDPPFPSPQVPQPQIPQPQIPEPSFPTPQPGIPEPGFIPPPQITQQGPLSPESMAGMIPAGMPTNAYMDMEQLSAEVLAKSQRNSKMAAIGAAVAIHVLILGLVGLVVVSTYDRTPPQIVSVQGRDTVPVEANKEIINPSKKRPTSATSQQASQLIQASGQSEISIPSVEDINIGDTLGISPDASFDIGLNPFAENSLQSFLPASISSRCTFKDREQRLAESGGKPEAEKAVVKALGWIKKQQNKDGSFGKHYKSAMTGLAVLSFMGHCDTPDSNEFGDSVLDAILYLVELGTKKEGDLRATKGKHSTYEHSIATYALAEAYSITKYGKKKIPRIRQVLEMAVPKIISSQTERGGWDYNFLRGDRDDLSVACWNVQALKAAQYTKIEFDGLNEAMDNAMKFLRDMQASNGRFGYSKVNNTHVSLTGAGALGLIIGTGSAKSKHVKRAIDDIIKTTDIDYRAEKVSLYAWYYNTQACFQKGGLSWKRWNRRFQSELLKNQNGDGSWPAEGPRRGDHKALPPATSQGAGKDADFYRTTLCTLMLEVYYRYLPATDTGAPKKGGDA